MYFVQNMLEDKGDSLKVCSSFRSCIGCWPPIQGKHGFSNSGSKSSGALFNRWVFFPLPRNAQHAALGCTPSMQAAVQLANCACHCDCGALTVMLRGPARAQGKRVAVSGSGNVAVYTVEKLLELGAVPLTVSDSSGYVYFEEGMSSADLDAVNTHKVINRGRLSDFKSGARLTLACFWLPCCKTPRRYVHQS